MSQREALLHAAITCLNERGYGKTTSRDIAATAGISSLAAIVYHYGSKEALLNAAIAEIVRRWIERLQQFVHGPDGGIDGLRAAAAEYYGTLEANRSALGGFVEALGHAPRSDDIREQMAQQYQGFRDSLAAIFEQNGHQEPNSPRLHAMSSVLMALVDGLLIQWLLDPGAAINSAELDRAITSLSATFLSPSAQDRIDGAE